MKKIVSWLLPVLCLLAMTACQSSEKRVRGTAEQFLKAYYSADYATAASYCTPAFAPRVSRGAEAQNRVPDEIAQKMKEAVSQTSFKIVSVTVDKEAGRAVVHYDLDVPMVERPVPKQLLLQLEGRAAAVDGIE
jgi:hypothetical protein